MKNNSITITYLSKVSFASLNGADKEVDNINPIKKVTLSTGEELPYVSSQALRRALRDRLAEMGWELSPVGIGGGDATIVTASQPAQYIDDDLMGFMDANARIGRTSPIRVEALLALPSYQYKGDLDYAVNFMGKGQIKDKKGKEIQPIFETEIHSGVYRGTILIELDRIGKGEGFESGEISGEEKANRVIAFLDAFQNLWSSGRQSRFLADISPKFIAAAYMKAKNPVFLEAVNVNEQMHVNVPQLDTVVSDYSKFIESHVFASQESVFAKVTDNVKSLKDGFETIQGWVKSYYTEN
jgi:CRISPR-associated protein Cst2